MKVYPFTRQGEGGEVVIGRPDTGTFLALPDDAVQILDDLATGRTIGAVRDDYEERHAERPDLEDLLLVLEQKGLVLPASAETPDDWTAAGSPDPEGFHFTSIPRGLARALCSPWALGLAALVILLGVGTAVLEPSILPARDALYFEESMTLKMFLLTLVSFGAIFLHELGHLVAVRAAGVDSRLGIGNRMWMLVVETDMTGLWAVPKRQRYLPVLAGPLVDAVSLSLVLMVIFAGHRGWIALGGLATDLLEGAALVYILGLVWQCFFFVRTDFYYVFSALFDCKNLLRDTEVFLKNQLARIVPGMEPTDQSGIPPREQRVIRGYSAVWLLGRVLALGVLVVVVIPVLGLYAKTIGAAVSAGYSIDPYRYLDALMIGVFGLVPLLIGLWMWSSGMVRRWRSAA